MFPSFWCRSFSATRLADACVWELGAMLSLPSIYGVLHFPTSVAKTPFPSFYDPLSPWEPCKNKLFVETWGLCLLPIVSDCRFSYSWAWRWKISHAFDLNLYCKTISALWYSQIWLRNYSTLHQKPTTYRAISARLWAWVASSWPLEVGSACAWCAPLTSVEWRNKKIKR